MNSVLSSLKQLKITKINGLRNKKIKTEILLKNLFGKQKYYHLIWNIFIESEKWCLMCIWYQCHNSYHTLSPKYTDCVAIPPPDSSYDPDRLRLFTEGKPYYTFHRLYFPQILKTDGKTISLSPHVGKKHYPAE